MLGDKLPLLYFLFLPWCLQILAICETVHYPPVFRLSYVGIFLTFFSLSSSFCLLCYDVLYLSCSSIIFIIIIIDVSLLELDQNRSRGRLIQNQFVNLGSPNNLWAILLCEQTSDFVGVILNLLFCLFCCHVSHETSKDHIYMCQVVGSCLCRFLSNIFFSRFSNWGKTCQSLVSMQSACRCPFKRRANLLCVCGKDCCDFVWRQDGSSVVHFAACH